MTIHTISSIMLSAFTLTLVFFVCWSVVAETMPDRDAAILVLAGMTAASMVVGVLAFIWLVVQ